MEDKIHVLYIHHSGLFGGASRSLLELIKSFPEDTVSSYLITQIGNTSEYFQKSNIETITTKGISQFDNGKYYYYQKLRWLILIRELAYLPFTISAIRKAKKKWPNIQIVHVNEVQLIIPAIIARMVFKKPIVIHSRSLQRNDPKSFRTKYIFQKIHKIASLVVPIDEAVKDTLPDYLNTRVIHNGFDPKALLEVNHRAASVFDNVPKRKLNVGMVGNLLGHKGVDEFVEAANILKNEGLDINFIVVGDKKSKVGLMKRITNLLGISHDVREKLVRKIEGYHLKENFHLLPFTPDLGDVYPNLDVLCFPNQTDAIGRPVFEAAYYNRPSIVCLSKTFDDTFINNVTGLNIRPKEPLSLAQAIREFYHHPEKIAQMGEQAKILATKNHDSRKNAEEMLEEYKKILKNDKEL